MNLFKKKWQYETVYMDQSDNRRTRNKLNEMGEEGWELVLTLENGYGIVKRLK